jgi:hypothetical protein
MVATLPAQGPAVWTDYVDNWRKADTQWLQDRIILRFADSGARDAALVSPGIGQVVYNQTTDSLELRGSAGAWRAYKPMPVNLVTTSDTSSSVAMGHTGAGGAGIVFAPGAISLTTALVTQMSVFTATGAGVVIQNPGQASATLTTDPISLVSSIPVKAPSITLTGSGTVFNAAGKTVTVGTLIADVGTIATLTVSGAITGSGVSTLGGVVIGSNLATASAGFVSGTVFLVGDSSSGKLTWRNASTGAVGPAFFSVDSANLALVGGSTYVNSQMVMQGGRGISYFDSGGSFRGNFAPVIYSASDPGVGNFPDGTLWIS